VTANFRTPQYTAKPPAMRRYDGEHPHLADKFGQGFRRRGRGLELRQELDPTVKGLGPA
jgi:hypothetical protein